MDIKDIGHSAASSSLDTAERAYRAIVSYPDGESIDGANVSSLYGALEHLCGALTDDAAVMPSETCDAAGVRYGSTYTEAAADFRANRGLWMHRIQSLMGGG